MISDEAREAAKSILWVETLIDDEEAIAQAFQAAIDAAIDAQRERDAKIAEDWDVISASDPVWRQGTYDPQYLAGASDASAAIAAAIRSAKP